MSGFFIFLYFYFLVYLMVKRLSTPLETIVSNGVNDFLWLIFPKRKIQAAALKTQCTKRPYLFLNLQITHASPSGGRVGFFYCFSKNLLLDSLLTANALRQQKYDCHNIVCSFLSYKLCCGVLML